MKYFKIILLNLFFTGFIFISCKNESVEVSHNTEQSVAAKNAMKALKTHFNPNGSLNRNENNPTNNIIFDFCFDFVYPITLSYNTNMEVTIQNLNGLIDVLVNMNNNLYIDGIAFPFQVEIFNRDTNTFEIVTIQNETAFMLIIDDCFIDDNGEQTDNCNCTEDYDPVCINMQDPSGISFTMEFPNFCFAECEGFTQNDVANCNYNNPSSGNIFKDCFNFIYPITVIYYDGSSSQSTQTLVNNDTELEMIFFSNYGVEFIYPFTIQTEDNGQTTILTITSNETFHTFTDNCNSGQDCNCSTNYDPVCVATSNGGTIQYDNQCLAECAGFTLNDIVNCPNNNNCEITDVTVQVGDCSNQSTYTIVLNFNVQNTNPSGTFSVTFSDGTTANNLYISNLPVSLYAYTNGTSVMDDLVITIDANQNCTNDIAWIIPNCSNNSGCWSFVYPITIDINGDEVPVNSDSEFDSIYDPVNHSIIYPFDVTIDNQTITINTPNDFYDIGEFDNRCN